MEFSFLYSVGAHPGSIRITVVSAATTAEILAKASDFPDIQPAALVLMIAGGSCMVSFVSYPYFWLVKRFTGDETTGVINNYTLPLAGIGLIIGFSRSYYPKPLRRSVGQDGWDMPPATLQTGCRRQILIPLELGPRAGFNHSHFCSVL